MANRHKYTVIVSAFVLLLLALILWGSSRPVPARGRAGRPRRNGNAGYSVLLRVMKIDRQSISPALVAVAAAMALLGTLYFASLLPGYSHISKTISELGETGAPQAHLVAFGFFLPVGLIVWWALWLVHRHRSGQDASLVLLALSGLGAGYVLAAFFACDPGGPLFGSWRTLVHNAGGLIDYGGTALGFWLFCRYCARHKMRPQAIAFGIAAALGFLAMVLLGLPPAFPVRGAVQRVTELIQFTGVFFVCQLLSTRPALKQRPALDAGTGARLQFGQQPPGASETGRQAASRTFSKEQHVIASLAKFIDWSALQVASMLRCIRKCADSKLTEASYQLKHE